MTLAPFRKKLFAVPAGSAETAWQFPPGDKETYRVSSEDQDELRALASELGLDSAGVSDRIDELSVEGQSFNNLRNEVNGAGGESDARDRFNARAREIVREHQRALDEVRALYGDIGLSGDSRTAYVPTYGGWLFALDVATGDLRWLADLDPMVGGPLVNGPTLYVGTKDDRIYALDAATGAIGESRKLDGEIWAAPTLAENGDDILVPTLGGSVYRLNDELGDVWRFNDADAGFAGRVTAAGGRVYAGSFDNKLYALDEATGDAQWDIEADNWFWSQPVVAEGTLFAASLDGKVYAVDAATGEARWQRPFDTDSQVRSGLVATTDWLIVASRDGRVRRLALDDGSAGGELQIGTKVEADLTIGEDQLVYAVPNRATLYVINANGPTLAADLIVELPD